jgi:membrane protein required for colicin V production
MSNFLEFIKEEVLLFDIIFILIVLYNIIKCFSQGFSLSFLSSLKWIVSVIVTIILVPKLQPWVSNYIESEFINNIGIGASVFIITLFISVVFGKSLGRTVTWSGLGSVDKSFGILFGVFKGYVVSVCFFFSFKLVLSIRKMGHVNYKCFFFQRC